MNDDESKRINELIATKVMGWTKSTRSNRWGDEAEAWAFGNTFIWCSEYDPYHNIAQAIEAAIESRLYWGLNGLPMSLCMQAEVVARNNTIHQRTRSGSDYGAAALSLALVAAVEAE